MKSIIIKNNRRITFLSRFNRGQKGQTLIEALIALAILGIVAIAFLTALTTSSVAMILADENTTAESLTRSELEDIKNSSYPIIGYDVAQGNYEVQVRSKFIDPDTHVEAVVDTGLQEITVTVYHEDPDPVLVTVTYKGNI
jgi:prepilin-type N-terminal cleavage/methylation domain-containing protein